MIHRSIGLALLLVSLGPAPAANAGTLARLYLNGGVALTAPSAEDLDFRLVGGSADELPFETNRAVYGLGVQVLLDLDRLRIGADLGWQKLFSSRMDLSYSDMMDVSEDRESSIRVLGLAEYTLADGPLFFQAGAGLHFVRWDYSYEFSGRWSSEDREEGGFEVSPGVMGGAGMELHLGPSLKVPVMARLDCIFRYGMILTGSVAAGLSFEL
jgi:hypothetical protein